MTTTRLTIAALGALTVATLARADDIANLKADVAALQNLVNNHQTTLNGLSTKTTMVTKKEQFMAVSGKTLRFQGCNLQLTNADAPSFPNGLGNLTVGWNKARMDSSDIRTGSAFLIVGNYNNFSGNGGFVSGGWNDAGQNTVVLSGYKNMARGMNTAILTGTVNYVDGTNALVGTGTSNEVYVGAYSGMVLGGQGNTVWGKHGMIAGGLNNTIKGGVNYAYIATGEIGMIETGDYSAILSGNKSTIASTGKHNVIGTGYNNAIRADCESVFLADGKDALAYRDYRNNPNGVPWKFRFMSEGKLFRNY